MIPHKSFTLLVLTLLFLLSFNACSVKYGTTYQVSTTTRNHSYLYKVTEINRISRGPHNIDGILPFPQIDKRYYLFETKKLGWIKGTEVKFYTYDQEGNIGYRYNYYDINNSYFYFSIDKLIIQNLKICGKHYPACSKVGLNREFAIQ